MSPEKTKWAYEKWCEGYTYEQISEALYCCPLTVKRALKGKKRERPKLYYEGK